MKALLIITAISLFVILLLFAILLVFGNTFLSKVFFKFYLGNYVLSQWDFLKVINIVIVI